MHSGEDINSSGFCQQDVQNEDHWGVGLKGQLANLCLPIKWPLEWKMVCGHYMCMALWIFLCIYFHTMHKINI